MAAAILGTGVLALPVNFAKLGLVIGSVTLLACYPLNFFTGYLLNRMHLAFPSVITLGDLGQRAMGPFGAILGYGGLYVLLFFILGNYMAVLGKSVQQIFYDSELCLPTGTVVAMALTLPMNQLRTLYYVSLMSVVSCVTIVSVVVISIAFLLMPGKSTCSQHELPPLDFMGGVGAFSGFFFAYSAQQVFLEMQAEMIEPAHFPRTLHVALLGMLTIYLGIALITYAKCHGHTPDYLLNVVPEGPWMRVTGVLMLAHMLVSYTISQQVFTRGLFCVSGCMAGLERGVKGRVLWFLATTALAGSTTLIANSIPKFDHLVDLVGALLVVPLCFILPVIFFMACWYRASGRAFVGISSGCGLKMVCWMVLVVATLLWVLGTYSGVTLITKPLGKGEGQPFGCNALERQH